VVSVTECKRARVEIPVGTAKMYGICKYLRRMSCSFVEIMLLVVVSVCIS